MSQVIDGFDFVIGVDDPVRQLGQAFLQTNISGHQPFLMFSSADCTINVEAVTN